MAKRTFVNTVSLELNEDVLAAVAQPGATPAAIASELKRLATYFIVQHALGGMFLEKRFLDAIERATGTVMQSQKDVVDAVSKGLGREEGQFTIKASIDPAFIEPLEEVAKWQSCTVEELLTNCVNMALTNGWLYEFSARSGMMIAFEGESWDTLCAFMGKGASTGAEIAEKLRAIMASNSEEKPAAGAPTAQE